VSAISEYFMLIQCLENIGEGLLHACISSKCGNLITAGAGGTCGHRLSKYQGPVVQSTISANPGLNFNLLF
jgi:hypothetical protein